jgi:hypothetical protein
VIPGETVDRALRLPHDAAKARKICRQAETVLKAAMMQAEGGASRPNTSKSTSSKKSDRAQTPKSPEELELQVRFGLISGLFCLTFG